MSYLRFGLMILTSTVVMFGLMYLNTYAWEHVFFSETRVYMAILMGATMAVVMLAYMLGMYANRTLNIAIFVGAALVLAGSLWLVRSQATVSGESYMRAMIPHHSIAIMTSERAQIRDPRVRHLADAIIAAQRREISEMRYLLAELAAGRTVETVWRDPPAAPGSIADALARPLLSTLHLAPMDPAEATRVLGDGPRCDFRRSASSDPVLWVRTEDGRAALKLNGVLVTLDRSGGTAFATAGATAEIRPEAGSAAATGGTADLVVTLAAGRTLGYRGRWACPG